jgi:ribose transport system ATP-binding protein
VTDEQLVSWAGGRDAPAAPPAPRHTIQAGAEAPAVEISDARMFAGGPAVNLAFEKRQIVGLGGLPDQGQKQLLRILAGLEGEPSGAARVTLAGEALPLGSAVGVAGRGVAFVSGDRDEIAFGQRSIRENMRAPFIARRGAAIPSDGALIQALARLSARYAGLDMPLASLSGGNQQKVLVARCLIADPKLIVAEDPTKGIDVAARADVHRLLHDLVYETGATVVITSSDDLELADLCDRILVFEGGRVIADLSRLDGTLSVETLVSAYMKQEMAA